MSPNGISVGLSILHCSGYIEHTEAQANTPMHTHTHIYTLTHPCTHIHTLAHTPNGNLCKDFEWEFEWSECTMLFTRMSSSDWFFLQLFQSGRCNKVYQTWQNFLKLNQD